jgi:tripartite-type tricarboxylate transporter receptor subunit TctC
MRIGRIVLASLCALTALLPVPPAAAQAYPSRPIKLIVPFPPGGNSDLLARFLGQRMSEVMGQQFVVENRAGAGAVIGTEALAKSPPDGYSLMLADMTLTISQAVFGKVPYDPLRDFTPITLVARAPQWLFVNSAVPATTARELIALAKAKPGTLKIGSAGNGSGPHLLGELFVHGAGVDILHVPYRGTGPAVAAVVAGEVDMVLTSMPAALGFVKAGRLRPVAVTTATRHKSFPDVPTFAESGVPELVLTHWLGVLAPAGLPAPIQERLRKEFIAVVNEPSTLERYAGLGLDPATSTPEEFQAVIASDLKRWAAVVKQANITPQ